MGGISVSHTPAICCQMECGPGVIRGSDFLRGKKKLKTGF